VLSFVDRWRKRKVTERDEQFLQAVERTDWEKAIRLLARGADVNARTIVGLTALHLASANGDMGLVGVLLRHGADMDGRSFGGTPLHLAAENGHYAVVKALLLHGANPFSVDPDGQTALERTEDPAIRGEIRQEMVRVKRDLQKRAEILQTEMRPI
jgi:hypothetical protein